MSSAPTAAYRLQLTPEFGFAQVTEIAPYLRELGVSHVYLSPVLQATPASPHGYDVVDHSRVRAEFGGIEGFRAMAETLVQHDLAVVLDIVPNHMAVPVPESANAALWSVLREGTASPHASWFDIDWTEGKVALPVLGDEVEPRVDGAVLRYHEHEFPHPGHYRLVDWRQGPGYRRFFDVSSLIGLRVEEPEVFTATHQVILELVGAGLVEGLRVDHPDGLADPAGYLAHLRERTGGVWTVVEKILVGEERLPPEWACDGTTGYEVLNWITRLFVDPAGAEPLIRLFHEMTGWKAGYRETMTRAKREVVDLFFRAEVGRLARAAGADPAVVAELLVALPVYRTYVTPGREPPPAAVQIVGRAVAACSSAVRPLAERVLRGDAETIVRFQQSSGPVMAKGVEDTALYRWFPLACLNEVGGEPDHFAVSPDEFHARCAELPPRTMTTLSTHDTKRSEDVRARLAVLAELPAEWAETVRGWAARLSCGDPHLDYLAWQTLLGAWPISAERLAGYLLKAAREAKTRTSWIRPDAAYEAALGVFAARAVELPIGAFAARVDPYAMVNSLGQKLVQLLAPGVPDLYQGNETTDFSLVDPDNRRPVRFPRQAVSAWDEAKLLLTRRALRLRRRMGDAPPYLPLAGEGAAAEHVVAFARGRRAVAVATRLPVRLARRGGWGATSLRLPPGDWRDLLTGGTPYTGKIPLAHLLHSHPVALLENHDL